jgi:hypothetical protein
MWARIPESVALHGIDHGSLASEFEALPWGEVLEFLRGTSLRALLDRIKADVDDVVGRLLKEAAAEGAAIARAPPNPGRT